MKQVFFTIALFSVVCIACTKEETVPVNNDNTPITVSGYIADDLGLASKTDYSIDGNTATFCWKGSETFTRLGLDGAALRKAKYSGDAGSGAREISFTQVETDAHFSSYTDYALYPQFRLNTTTDPGFDFWSNPFFLKLFESISYNKNSPLANIVPMIGKMTDGKFVFNVATGIIAVRMTNIPSNATKLTISSSTKMLNGGFRYSSGTNQVLSQTDELENIYNNGLQIDSPYSASNTKTFTGLDSLDPDEEYVFYFPIPVGTLTDGLTVTLKSDSKDIYSIKTSQNISSVRGEITRLPLITLPHASLSVGGTSNDIKVTLTEKTNFSYVKVYAASTLDAASAGIDDYGTTITNVNEATSINGNFGASGQYYIAYKGYNSNNEPIADFVSGSLGQYYYLNTTNDGDAKDLLGEYSFTNAYALLHYYRSDWKALSGTDANNLVITASNDLTKGNIMITEIFGFNCNGTPSTNIVNGLSGTTSDLTGEFGAGSPVYGKFISGNLSFTDADQTPFIHYTGTHSNVNKQWDIYVGGRVSVGQVKRDVSFGFSFASNATNATLTVSPSAFLLLHFDGSSNTNADNCILYVHGGSTNTYVVPVATRSLL